MAEIKRNCWSCGWANGTSCTLPWSDDNYISVGDFVAEHCQAADGMPTRDADNCPGWKPTPGEDAPGAAPAVATMPDDALNLLDRVAALERAVRRLESGDGSDR